MSTAKVILVNHFFIIVSGSCRFSASSPDGSSVTLGTLEQNDWFGELALLQQADTKRTFTVTALETCVMLMLKREKFEHFLEVAPEMKVNL